MSDNIFREYDVRGVFGKDLTEEVAELLARAYAIYLRKNSPEKGDLKVTIGRDVRLSSPALRDSFIKGLSSSGINCMDIGACPTPLQYFSMNILKVHGGVMITGSHNPPEYNGFKISVGKETIHGNEIQRLKYVLREEVLKVAAEDKRTRHGEVDSFEVIPQYIENIARRFSLPALNTPLKVVLDCGNGTAGPVAPELLRRLGCDVIALFPEPDGRFPNHHPDPTIPENLKELINTVKKEKADFGVAYDGDADRIGVVDEKGEIIWGDNLMVIFAGAILKKSPGATIVGEVKCSQVMYDEIERLGGRPVMWKTGHSLIKAKMKELKAAMAGEMSGHIFFADKYFGYDDAIYASCRLVEIMAEERQADKDFKFSRLLSGLPKTFSTPEIRIDCPDNLKFDVIERLGGIFSKGSDELKLKDVIRVDGLRAVFEGGWALVRASNTQPVLVLRFEATSNELLKKAKGFVREGLKTAWPDVEAAF
ncbi:MAG: phosphomannomutase/phosphoglucomutase [Deltaproteobacteria bacterium]